MEIIDKNGNTVPNQQSKRVLTGIIGIILGSLGIHKFILGYTKEGLILLGFAVVTCGIGTSLTGLIGLIEGIIYLTKSDDEFMHTYQANKKAWF